MTVHIFSVSGCYSNLDLYIQQLLAAAAVTLTIDITERSNSVRICAGLELLREKNTTQYVGSVPQLVNTLLNPQTNSNNKLLFYILEPLCFVQHDMGL